MYRMFLQGDDSAGRGTLDPIVRLPLVNGGGDHEAVSLADGSSDARRLFAAAYHDHNDHHDDYHRPSSCAPTSASYFLRATGPWQLRHTGYTTSLSTPATGAPSVLSHQ